jgi:serine/threonine protein kinase
VAEERKIDRYLILGEIGRGQMSVVYKAQDPSLNRIVALKVVRAEELPQPDVLRKCLRREMKLAGKLRHSNIVTIYDAGEEGGNPFIAMEYLEGPTLAEYVGSGTSSQQAVDIALQLCDALGYAHEEGVVHGDLKPSNIVILEDRKVKVTDFGLARSIQASVAGGTFTGTLVYAPPEQLRGDPIDGRSDVFSLGIILFEMLTGRRPFEDGELGKSHLAREQLDRIPSKFLRNVLQRVLASDAGRRYQTCATLGRDLRKYQSGCTLPFTRNPFIHGPPIIEPQDFYGRGRELQIITGRLKNAAPGSSAIIGGRRIGKTSLLRKLSHPSVAREYGFSDDYLFVYLPPFTADPVSDVETQFWHLILRGVLGRMREGEQVPPDSALTGAIERTLAQARITFKDVEGIFAEIGAQGYKTVLLFDEFQCVVGNEAFQFGFFGGLRGLTQTHNLAFVTESNKNLRELARTDKVASSPFWNVFTNVYLGPFNEREARELIEGYTQRTDVSFTTEDVDYVLRMSGGHPYFLQLACWYVFDAYQEGQWGKEVGVDHEKARRRVEDEFFRQAEPHFAYFWEHSAEVERRALIVLVYRSQEGKDGDHGRKMPALQPGPGFKTLNERGLIVKTESVGYEIFSPFFAMWIKRHVEANCDEELVPHLRYFWRQMEKDERRLLTCLARRRREESGLGGLIASLRYKLIAHPESSLGDLMRRGLVIRMDDGGYEVFSPLFASWILSQ